LRLARGVQKQRGSIPVCLHCITEEWAMGGSIFRFHPDPLEKQQGTTGCRISDSREEFE
jgi:hypothetical protein